jgi:hypothetical protein
MFPLDPYKSVQATGTERIITMEDPVGFMMFSSQSVQTQENHLTSGVPQHHALLLQDSSFVNPMCSLPELPLNSRKRAENTICPTITGEKTIVATKITIPIVGLGTNFIRCVELVCQ